MYVFVGVCRSVFSHLRYTVCVDLTAPTPLYLTKHNQPHRYRETLAPSLDSIPRIMATFASTVFESPETTCSCGLLASPKMVNISAHQPQSLLTVL